MSKSRVRKLFQQYESVLEDWQIRLAIARIRRFRLPPDVWEDVMQEVATLIFQFRFDPEKAHAACEETILCRMIDRQIKMLVRRHGRQTAGAERYARLSHQEEEPSRPEDAVIAAELQALIATFTPLQQEICRHLMDGENPQQIALHTGRAWTTVQRHIGHIREALAEAGFGE